ncbi:MAG TPA: PIN domain-containing protein [Blastocatellia bacterium]|nr:PIN domain-containing protein [Blastocatellia bacterium]
MATFLLDTNLLLRLSDGASPHQALADQAIKRLRLRGDRLCLTAQNLIEFWAVATRPAPANGFGWDTQKTRVEIDQLLNKFPLLDDMPAILTNWINLVTTHGVKGKKVHDARLVAVMQAHGVTHLLTFNTDDFKGYSGITLVHPSDVN